MRILFVSSNPHFTEKLDLEEELRTLQRCLRGHEGSISPHPAARIADLDEALSADGGEPIDIVHFCGHADGKNGLYFRDPEGLEDELPPEELRKILDNKHVKLVVLNACKTRETADALIPSGTSREAVVDAVISTEKRLDDNVGVLMTKVLYSELGNNKSLADAFAKAEEMITAPRMTERDKSRFVYKIHSSETSETSRPLFAQKRAPKTEAKIEPKIDSTELQKFNRSFYINYLDEQIDTLTKNVATNRALLWIFVALLIGLLVVSGAWRHIVDFIYWLGLTLVGEAATPKERPLLDSLPALGQAIPAYYAVLQARWCVHGGVKLRQLKALQELVKKSDQMDPSLQSRLDKIMDESIRAADANWKPLFSVFLELIGAAARSKEQNNNPEQETVTP